MIDSAITIAHSHYDQLAAEKLKMKISKNYLDYKETTVIFSDTTISKNNFENFLLYLTTMVPLAFDNDQDAKLNIIFQDHHLGPMQKVITQISYLDHENINDLSENLTITALENFKRIQSLVKSKKLFFINVTSNDCQNNKQPSSELLLELIKPLNILTNEQLFFITSCILAEKISIFSANDKIVRQGLLNFNFSLTEQEIIDLLDYIDDKLVALAQKINEVFPFNKIDAVNDFSSQLMIALSSSNFITELFEVVTAKKIPLSEKRIKVETSTKPLILIDINGADCFVATPFPRQSITRSLTLILEKVRKSIDDKLKIKVVAFLLANDSGVVSVISYNNDVYCKLNDLKSHERQALPAPNFIRVGHVNAFVLKTNDGNYSVTFKKTLSDSLTNDVIDNKISKIEGVNKYLEYYQNLKLDISEINSEQEAVANSKLLTNIVNDVSILEKKLSLKLEISDDAESKANLNTSTENITNSAIKDKNPSQIVESMSSDLFAAATSQRDSNWKDDSSSFLYFDQNIKTKLKFSQPATAINKSNHNQL
ncbi:hypothetical protein [Spiroplasma endosymbiont of Polydrusus pterygomalis]|uniref:hypothetical protein n=1 Tax=Spiroplasma endosymbiont of Polydrusus pterygomalis TaxID=3139327 RepID=UPI003CCAC256